MKTKEITVEIRRPKSRRQLREERRLRRLENVLNVILGIGSAAVLFWAGWLVGSGAF